MALLKVRPNSGLLGGSVSFHEFPQEGHPRASVSYFTMAGCYRWQAIPSRPLGLSFTFALGLTSRINGVPQDGISLSPAVAVSRRLGESSTYAMATLRGSLFEFGQYGTDSAYFLSLGLGHLFGGTLGEPIR